MRHVPVMAALLCVVCSESLFDRMWKRPSAGDDLAENTVPEPTAEPAAATEPQITGRHRRSPMFSDEMAAMPSHPDSWMALFEEFPRLLVDVRQNAHVRADAELRGIQAYNSNSGDNSGPTSSLVYKKYRRETSAAPAEDDFGETAQVLQPEDLRKVLSSHSDAVLPGATHYTLVRTHETTTTTTTTTTTPAPVPAAKQASATPSGGGPTTASRLPSGRSPFSALSGRPEGRTPATRLRVFRREAYDSGMLKEMTRAHEEFEFGQELLEHHRSGPGVVDGNKSSGGAASSSIGAQQLEAQVKEMGKLLDSLQQLSPALPKPRFRRDAFEQSMLKEMAKAADEFEFADDLLQQNQRNSANRQQMAAGVHEMEQLLDSLQQLSSPSKSKSRFRREAFEPRMLEEMAKAANEFEFAEELLHHKEEHTGTSANSQRSNSQQLAARVEQMEQLLGSLQQLSSSPPTNLRLRRQAYEEARPSQGTHTEKKPKESNRSTQGLVSSHQSMFEAHVKQVEEMMDKMRSLSGHAAATGGSSLSSHTTGGGHSAAPSILSATLSGNVAPTSGRSATLSGHSATTSGHSASLTGSLPSSDGRSGPFIDQSSFVSHSPSSSSQFASRVVQEPWQGGVHPAMAVIRPPHSTGIHSRGIRHPASQITSAGAKASGEPFSSASQPATTGERISLDGFSGGKSSSGGFVAGSSTHPQLLSPAKKLSRRAAAEVPDFQVLAKAVEELDLVSEVLKASSSPTEAIDKMKATGLAIDQTLHRILGSVHQSDIDNLIEMTRVSSNTSSLETAGRERRAAEEEQQQQLEAAVTDTLASVAKASKLVPLSLNSAYEAMLAAEEQLDHSLRQLIGQEQLDTIVQNRRLRRSTNDDETNPRRDEFAWLLQELDLSEAEARSLHLATVEDIRRYARGRLREQFKQREAKGGGSLVFPESSTVDKTGQEDGGGNMEDFLRGLRQAIPSEVEAAALGAVEVGKHVGARIQPLLTDTYRTMAYQVLPQARKTLADSMSPEVKDFARQGRTLMKLSAQAASDYARPGLESLQENLGLLRSQIQQVASEARDYAQQEFIPNIVPTFRGLMFDLQETLTLASEVIQDDLAPLVARSYEEIIKPGYHKMRDNVLSPAYGAVSGAASTYVVDPLAESTRPARDRVEQLARPAFRTVQNYAVPAYQRTAEYLQTGVQNAAETSQEVYQNNVRPALQNLTANAQQVIQERVRPAVEGAASTMRNRAAQLGETIRTDVVPPLKDTAKSVLNGVFTGIPTLVQQASYEAHDAAKVFRGKYSEVLRSAKEAAESTTPAPGRLTTPHPSMQTSTEL